MRIPIKEAQIDQNQITGSLIEAVKYPKGKVLPKAVKLRRFEFDPTIILNEDVKDQEGNTIIAKGSKVNPLDTTALHEDLLFFDGNSEEQLNWAKNLEGIWILTDGNPLELEKKNQKPIYFDQGSYLISKLGIQALPARVYQKDKRLVVEESPCF